MKKKILFLAAPLEVLLQIFFKGKGWGIANTGISFGWFAGMPVVILLVGLVVAWFAAKEMRSRWWWKLIIVGGGANLIARVVLGSVWDYLHLPILNLWFNGADLAIFLGVCGLAVASLGYEKH